jgi:hypothetical protein
MGRPGIRTSGNGEVWLLADLHTLTDLGCLQVAL